MRRGTSRARRPRSGCAPRASSGRRFAGPPRRARRGSRRRPGSRRAWSSCRRRSAPRRAVRRRRSRRSAASIVATSEVRRSSATSGSASAELLEEHGRERRVPVLARVHDDLLESRLAERHRERRRLDELGPVPDDRQQPHRSSSRAWRGAAASRPERSPRRSRPRSPSTISTNARAAGVGVRSACQAIVIRRGGMPATSSTATSGLSSTPSSGTTV